MNIKLPGPRSTRTDTQESAPLLTAYDDHIASHTENTSSGGSALDGAALRRNEQDGKNIVHKLSLHGLSEY